MTVYTYSEARQKFATILDKARVDGSVQIVRKDGQTFLLTPIVDSPVSPLDVVGIDSDITSNEIVSTLREFRER